MMKFIVLTAVFLLKVLFTKLLLLIMTFSLFFIKGKSLNFDSEKWDLYLDSLDKTFVFRLILIVYLLSSMVSSIFVFKILCIDDFKSPLILTVIIFSIAAVVSFTRYRNNRFHVDSLLNKSKYIK